MNTRTDRIYRLTQAGIKALQCPSSVPDWYRAILESMRGETHSSLISERMRSHPQNRVLGWLDELDTLGFVELVNSASALPPPDTTGRFSIHSLAGRREAA